MANIGAYTERFNMFEKSSVDLIVSEFVNDLDKSFTEVGENIPADVLDRIKTEGWTAENVSDARDLIRGRVLPLVRSALPIGCVSPEISVIVTGNTLTVGDGEEVHNLHIACRPLKGFPLREFNPTLRRYVKNVNDVTLQDLVEYFAALLMDVIYKYYANENITRINEVFADSLTAAGQEYTVSFMLDSEVPRAKRLASISDDAVTFVVPQDRSYEAANLLVFNELESLPELGEDGALNEESLEDTLEGDDDSIEDIMDLSEKIATNQSILQAREDLIHRLSLYLNPISFVAAREPIIKVLTGITTQQAHTLARGAYSHKLNGVRDFGSDTDVFVEKDDVISVVRIVGGEVGRGADAEVEVLLSPCRIGTLEPADDFDVIALVKDRLAK